MRVADTAALLRDVAMLLRLVIARPGSIDTRDRAERFLADHGLDRDPYRSVAGVPVVLPPPTPAPLRAAAPPERPRAVPAGPRAPRPPDAPVDPDDPREAIRLDATPPTGARNPQVGAWRAGVEAAASGAPRSSCPYQTHARGFRRSWLDGFDGAIAAAAAAREAARPAWGAT